VNNPSCGPGDLSCGIISASCRLVALILVSRLLPGNSLFEKLQLFGVNKAM